MNTRNLIILVATGILVASCQKDFNKFDRPSWLEGKLYSELLTVPDIDTFVACVERSGYDTIINASGSYTVFAPTNQAFGRFFAANPGYHTVNSMPIDVVTDIVKIHIVQSPWSKTQLRTLDVNGWINKRDPLNDEPWGYKRQTLLKDDNKKYWITVQQSIPTIVDSANGTDTRVVYNPSRKYLPLFFDEYLAIAEVTSGDYEFFFDRPFESGNVYYSNAKIDDEDFFAENGFIYRIDEVVFPLKNVEQFLESNEFGNDYSMYLGTIRKFPRFAENLEETNKQPGAKEGLEVPKLYNLDYPQLVFDINEELTGRDIVDVKNTVRYHYGMLAPTNVAMQDLIDNIITDNSGYPHWANFTLVPENIKRIIANTHMSESPVYLSDLERGFINGEKDSIFVDPATVVEKHYASNATFFGLNKAIVPRAFTSIAGPVYLRPGFRSYMYAIEFSKILPAIKRRNSSYSFFVIPDEIIRQDSSLFIAPDVVNPRRYNVTSYDRGARQISRRTEFELNLQMLNQVGVTVPKELARKEFIPNLAGNYIVYNTEPVRLPAGPGDSVYFDRPTVTGGVASTYGYNGDSIIGVVPIQLEEPTDNGVTYNVNGWFTFPRTGFYFALNEYSQFFQLIRRAGLIDDVYKRFTFTTDSELYTVFVPSAATLSNNQELLDSMSTEELAQFVKYHFVPGSLIFTDGNARAGKYETLRVDESTTIYNTAFSSLDLSTGIDQIEILDNSGDVVFNIEENGTTTNIMTAIDISNDNNLQNYITNGVLHEIDTILLKQ